MTLQTEKITKIDYRLIPNTTVAEYGLVSEVRVKDGSTNFLQKKSTTAYNLSTAYVSRRILGLPSKTVSWGYDQSNSQLEKVSEVD
ncbi:MAG: hypothetical protein IPN69_09160 [Acidobacteria bacterium]|nr:hypothetical protein [Acidobacteriota bacterium]